MKFTEEQIEKYNNDFHIECSIEALKKEWYFDKKGGFISVDTKFMTKRMIYLKTIDNDWIRIPFYDLTQEQIESLLIDKEPIDENRLNEFEEQYEESLSQDYFWIEDCDDGEGTHGVCSVCEIENAYKAGYHKAKEE